MRIPLITIPLSLIAGASIYVGAIYGVPPALVLAFLSWYVMFIGCLFVNSFRQRRVERHPIARLPSDEFQRLCRDNAEARITFYDSVYAGNCIPGTQNFVKRTFRGRRSITLGELLPYCRSAKRVKNVAVYKLIQLSRASRKRAA